MSFVQPLLGLLDELRQLAPFGRGEANHPAVVVAEDDLIGIVEVDGRAAPLGAAQRQHAGLQAFVFFRQVGIHTGYSLLKDIGIGYSRCHSLTKTGFCPLTIYISL